MVVISWNQNVDTGDGSEETLKFEGQPDYRLLSDRYAHGGQPQRSVPGGRYDQAVFRRTYSRIPSIEKEELHGRVVEGAILIELLDALEKTDGMEMRSRRP